MPRKVPRFMPPRSRRRASGPARVAWAAALTVALALMALGLAGPASAFAQGRHGPSGPAFWDPPKHLPAGAHGALIWQRTAHGLVPLDNAKKTKLVLYKSRTPQGKVDAVSGSVSVPKGKPPRRGWPVITYAHGTTGTADPCAPTRVRAGSPVQGYVTYVDPQLNDWLKAGYAVVRTDYQGLGTPGPHAYLIGKAEGRSVLDIVRAAHQLFPGIGKRMLIAGHSQGGHAALFAAGEAAKWTPELRLRGTVAYAPASHLLEQAKALPALTKPSPLSAEAALVVRGAETASPGVMPYKLLKAEPRRLFPLTNQTCLPQLSQSNRFGGIAPADLLRKDADLNPLYGVLADENPAISTAAPIFVAQGSADTTVFPQFTAGLVNQLDGLGDKVRYHVFQGVDHGAIVAAAEDDVLPWFEKRLPPGT